ncbi:MFS transporter [Segatella hominis]|uniref:MFS transporter n=1 Tax=Segatella hominis TaxID=2518605 RepID=A0A4Y8VJB3_9BACT|nr:MFS transporter [Segatella hominis]TFH80545.1 MFS transporter [Segatella hominis]
MKQLKENKGIERSLLLTMAVIAGLTVANCYYNQPLLEMIRHDMGVSQHDANLITVVTQIGYALGLCFLIPMGDLYSRRRIIVINMSVAAVMAVFIAFSQRVWIVWGASLLLGACSVIPQFFIPIAGQYSEKKNKGRNMGIVLSGLLTGILASRVVSGYVGEWLGWREMFIIAALIMIVCLILTLKIMPQIDSNYVGTYRGLMKSVFHIVASNARIRLYAIRAAFSFGSMMAIWSCLAFRLAQTPFFSGSEMVGTLGMCGIAGALAASGLGKLVNQWGIRKLSLYGACLQLVAWTTAYLFGDTYMGLIVAIILVDIGLQCLQLSNQSGCIQEMPEASNRANTIFMTTYFIGGSFGTYCAGLAWTHEGWMGVCAVGAVLAAISLSITICNKKISC